MLPLVALLAVCYPFWHQMVHGNLNLVLLALLTGTWAADRRGRPWLAGGLLGAAVAVKLFPAFLVVYFLARRRWKVLAGAAGSLAALTLLTAVVLGPATYRAYLIDGLPEASRYCTTWNNLSLAGLWAKLFDTQRPTPLLHVRPLWESRSLALAAFAVCAVAVVAVVARLSARARSRRQADLAYGLAVVGMLLVTPLVWDYYLLLLALPLAVLWPRVAPSEWARWLYAAIVAILCLSPAAVMEHVLTLLGAEPTPTVGWEAGPVQALTALSVHTWALLALFGLGVALWRRGNVRGVLPSRSTANGATSGRHTVVQYCPQ